MDVKTNKVFCPKCGKYQEAKPATQGFSSDDPEELYEDGGYTKNEDDEVVMSQCHIEAGPYNGKDNLVDYDTHLCECSSCGNTFATDNFATQGNYTVVCVDNENGEITSDHQIDCEDGLHAIRKTAELRDNDSGFDAVVAVPGHMTTEEITYPSEGKIVDLSSVPAKIFEVAYHDPKENIQIILIDDMKEKYAIWDSKEKEYMDENQVFYTLNHALEHVKEIVKQRGES